MVRRNQLTHGTTSSVLGVVSLTLVAVGLSTAQEWTAAAETCTAAELVVARGTNEPGYLGTEIGDPLYAAVQTAASATVSAYRVTYPANLLDPLSVGTGSNDLVSHLINQAAACPGQRFVLAGYSQGAAVVHTVLGTPFTHLIPGSVQLPADLAPQIAAVLLFGDLADRLELHVPGNFSARTHSFCTPGDPLCWPGGDNPPAHVAYANTIDLAATLAAQAMNRPGL